MRRNFYECIDRWLMYCIFTVRNEVAKVMFLQVSVCPGGSASVHAGIPHPPGADPPRADIILGADTSLGPDTPSPQDQTPPRDQTPPPRRLLLRTVCILLECILVFNFESLYFASKWSNGNQNVDTIVEFYL